MREIDAHIAYLRLDPWDALIAIVNNKYRLDLRRDSTSLVEFTPMEGTRTAIRLSSKRSTKPENLLPAYSERTFHYDRINMVDFFGNTPIVLQHLRAPISTHKLVKWLANQYNFVFASDDFINEIIETDSELDNYTLEASPRSLRWYGSIQFTTQNNKIDLAGLTNVNLTQTLNYTQADSGKMDGSLFLMDLDFTYYRNELLTMEPDVNVIGHKRLSMIINRMTEFKHPWRCAGEATTWNIGTHIENDIPRYTVLYNGPVSQANWTPRDDVRNVLVLALSESLCTNLGGYLLLHYN